MSQPNGSFSEQESFIWSTRRLAKGSPTLNVQNLLLSTYSYRGIAQLVEHWSPKPGVVGSSPATPAIKLLVCQIAS
jgi:hypothetical protein